MSNTPFLGLNPFSEEDSPFFFGRNEQKRVIARCLTVSRLTVLFGESGVGKSSILQAGVVPLLRRDAEKNQQEYGSAGLAIVVFRDWHGKDPLQCLFEQIRAGVAEALKIEATSLQMKSTPLETLQHWTHLLGGGQGVGQIFLILDQFESYFQPYPQESGEETFAHEFPQWVNRSDLRVNFLIGIRKDALGELHHFGESILHILDNRLELTHLDRSSAKEAIVKPIGEYNLRQIIASHLQTARLTVLSGDKGLGKSCVLRSIANNFQGVVLFSSWHGNPVTELVQQIETALKARFPDLPSSNPKASLTENLREWTTYIAGEEQNNQLFIILDQFEEFFQYQSPDESEGGFVTEFSHAVNAPDLLSVHFLISIQDDAKDLLKHFQQHTPNIFDHLLQIKQLEKNPAISELVNPIQEPVQQASTAIQIEPELVKAVLDQISPLSLSNLTEPVTDRDPSTSSGPATIEAPLLQLVMKHIWDEEMAQGSRCLRLETLESQGGVKQIVETHLSQVMESFSEAEQTILARVFQHLVTVSGARHAYSTVELLEVVRIDQIQLEQILETLSSGTHRILRPIDSTEPEKPETRRYEIFHDVLAKPIREWGQKQRLKEELKAEQEKAKQERQDAIRKQKIKQRLAIAFTSLIGLTGAIAAWGFQQTQINQLNNILTNFSLTQQISESQFEDSNEIEGLFKLMQTLHQNKASNRYSLSSSYLLSLISFQATLEKNLNQIREQNQWPTTNGTIRSSSFTPDGEYFALGSTDGSIQVWPVEGSSVPRCKDLTGRVGISSISVSSDNQYLVAALENGTVRLWALKDCIPGQQFQHSQELPIGEKVTSVSFHPQNSRLLLTGSENGNASLWTIQDKESKNKILLERSDNSISSVQFSQDGKNFAIGFAQGEVEIWELQADLQATLLNNFKAHDQTVTSLSFSPDNRSIITGSKDTTVKRWILQGNSNPTDTLISKFEQPVYNVGFMPNGSSLLASSEDGTARWIALDGHTMHTFSHNRPVWSISINPQRPQLLTTTEGSVRLWDLGSKNLPGFRASQNNPIRGVAWSSNSQLRGVAWSPNGQQIAIVAEGLHVASLWTLEGKILQEFKGHQGPVLAINFSPNGKQLATASGDSSARLWTTQGKTLQEFKGHQGPVLAVRFSPDGQQLATASSDGTARLWNLQDKSVQEFKGHQGPVNDVSLSSDGELIATASSDGTARLWNRQGKTLQEFNPKGNRKAVLSIDMSPDDQHIVTGSENTVRLWSAQGRLLAELPDLGMVRTVRFSPDGQQLAIALDNGTVLLATAKGELKGLVTNNNGVAARSLSFSPDNQQLIVGLGDGQVTLWPAQPIPLNTQISKACSWLKNYLSIHPEQQEELSFCPRS